MLPSKPQGWMLIWTQILPAHHVAVQYVVKCWKTSNQGVWLQALSLLCHYGNFLNVWLFADMDQKRSTEEQCRVESNLFLSQNLGFLVPAPGIALALNVSCCAFVLLNRALCCLLGNNRPKENQECTIGAWPVPCRPALLQLECVPTVSRHSVPLGSTRMAWLAWHRGWVTQNGSPACCPLTRLWLFFC